MRAVMGAVLAAVSAACAPQDSWELEGAFDQRALMQLLATQRYRQELVRVSEDPFPSGIKGESVLMYVSPNFAAQYTQLSSGHGMAPQAIPVGTLMIREVLDSNRRASVVTAAAKAPAGYNPEVADLWWAVAQPDGTVMTDASGTALVGPVSSCNNCHRLHEQTAFLYGMPKAQE